MLFVLMLTLTVINYDTGDELYKETRQILGPGSQYVVSDIKECYDIGVPEARGLTETYKKQFPNASTNVKCNWVKV